MIGYWGYLEFETNDTFIQYPENIERTVKGRWKTVYPADGGRPRRIFQGADVGQITFTMYFDQRFTGDIRVWLDQITIWVNEGYAQELVIGTKPLGHNKWVCTKAVEKFREVLHYGVIASAAVEVTLEEY